MAISRSFYFLFILLLYFGISSLAAERQWHTADGTYYGQGGAQSYAETQHGDDGAVFLDPYFIPYLHNANNMILLDAGCGAGPWAILAAQNGAKVYGIDIQEAMIRLARAAAIKAKVERLTYFDVGDVGHLPYPDNFFDRAISINVGCNLPQLVPHIQELQRVLKNGALAIVTAPYSFEIVFTDGVTSDAAVTEKIQRELEAASSIDQLPDTIKGLDNVKRATFFKRQGKWTLVKDVNHLIPGEEIWRKIPSMSVPNYFHSEKEYLDAFKNAGFNIKQVTHPHFVDESTWRKYLSTHNRPLSAAYIKHAPFVIFVVEKL